MLVKNHHHRSQNEQGCWRKNHHHHRSQNEQGCWRKNHHHHHRSQNEQGCWRKNHHHHRSQNEQGCWRKNHHHHRSQNEQGCWRKKHHHHRSQNEQGCWRKNHHHHRCQPKQSQDIKKASKEQNNHTEEVPPCLRRRGVFRGVFEWRESNVLAFGMKQIWGCNNWWGVRLIEDRSFYFLWKCKKNIWSFKRNLLTLIFCKEFFVEIRLLNYVPSFCFLVMQSTNMGPTHPPNNKHATQQFGGL